MQKTPFFIDHAENAVILLRYLAKGVVSRVFTWQRLVDSLLAQRSLLATGYMLHYYITKDNC
jgi:hypothetical protein